jgi:hypothetical protein
MLLYYVFLFYYRTLFTTCKTFCLGLFQLFLISEYLSQIRIAWRWFSVYTRVFTASALYSLCLLVLST